MKKLSISTLLIIILTFYNRSFPSRLYPIIKIEDMLNKCNSPDSIPYNLK